MAAGEVVDVVRVQCYMLKVEPSGFPSGGLQERGVRSGRLGLTRVPGRTGGPVLEMEPISCLLLAHIPLEMLTTLQ